MILVRVTSCGGLSHGWAARVGKAKDFGDLIEAFTNGIIAGSADNFEMIMAFHVDDLGVATGNHSGKKRKFWRVAAEPVSVDVGFEVMSRVEWLVVQDGFGACGERAYK